MSVDDTARAILNFNSERYDGVITQYLYTSNHQRTPEMLDVDLKALARLWLLLPEIRAHLGAANDVTNRPTLSTQLEFLLAKLSDESLSKDFTAEDDIKILVAQAEVKRRLGVK